MPLHPKPVGARASAQKVDTVAPLDLIKMVLGTTAQMRDNLKKMTPQLRFWKIPNGDRQRLTDTFDVYSRTLDNNHQILSAVTGNWGHVLDGQSIRKGIEIHTRPLRNIAEGIRKDASVSRVLAVGGLSDLEKHQLELLNTIADVLDGHCDGLERVAEVTDGTRVEDAT